MKATDRWNLGFLEEVIKSPLTGFEVKITGKQILIPGLQTLDPMGPGNNVLTIPLPFIYRDTVLKPCCGLTGAGNSLLKRIHDDDHACF